KIYFMEINFHKYQGTGNDFVMLDNRNGEYNQLSISQIQMICDRRFGIGADGLICINKQVNYAFEVDYSNSDGSKSFCGNGARCSVAFAAFLGI
ncbi:diaminopimelate epimerase, partial [Listeria monocytogenes]